MEAVQRNLEETKVDPAQYKHGFDNLVALNMPYSDNEFILMDEVGRIILEDRLKRYLTKIPVKTVFSWKYVQCGIGSLKIDVGVFEDAVREKNALQSYATFTKILDTAEEIKIENGKVSFVKIPK